MLEVAPNSEPPVDPSARTARPMADDTQPALGDASSGSDLRPGTVLKGCYRIERRLGVGGMGTVYLAQHLEIEKLVAIKVLGPESIHRPQIRERFLREARATASIEDEHVIAIHDFGTTPEGVAFFVMEYLQGVDLAAVIKHHAPLSWPRARDIALQISMGMTAAHAKGVVHRDMKPANVFRIDRSGAEFIKVLDFGLAKVIRPEKSVGEALTQTGMLFGTPEYMSPEQAQGGRHDHRVDIYALGVILFEMLTGRPPFRADTFMGLLQQHTFDPPPRPSDVAPHAGIPPAAEAVVLKALQKDPALRFQTMTEMAEALRAASSGVAPVVVRERLKTRPLSGTATMFSTTEGRVVSRRGPMFLVAGLGAAAITALALSGVLGPGATEVAPFAQIDPPAPVVVDEEIDAPGRGLIVPLAHIAAPPVPAPMVVLHIDTHGVAARVYDEHDATIGDTSGSAGIALPRGTEERRLSLRAGGYQDLVITVVPDADQTLPTALIRTTTRPRGAGKVGPKPVPIPPTGAPMKAKTTSAPELIPPNFDTH